MPGRIRPPEIFLSFVFWMATVTLVFQASYLSGQTDWWRLAASASSDVAPGSAMTAKVSGSISTDATKTIGALAGVAFKPIGPTLGWTAV